jgi:hypothetical protein
VEWNEVALGPSISEDAIVRARMMGWNEPDRRIANEFRKNVGVLREGTL